MYLFIHLFSFLREGVWYALSSTTINEHKIKLIIFIYQSATFSLIFPILKISILIYTDLLSRHLNLISSTDSYFKMQTLPGLTLTEIDQIFYCLFRQKSPQLPL